MWRGGQMRQKRLNEVLEEERGRRNLSQLIRTVQQIPSTRSRLDTNSLWTVVGELESFGPLAASNSVQFASNDVNRSFSRKYLNLRLYPSRKESESVSPRCRKTSKSSLGREVRDQKVEASVSTNKKSKKSKNRCGSKNQRNSSNSGLIASGKAQEKGPHVNNKQDRSKMFGNKDVIEKDNPTIKSNNVLKATKDKVFKKKSTSKLQTVRVNTSIIQTGIERNEHVQKNNRTEKNVYVSLKRNYSLESWSSNQNELLNTRFETYTKPKHIPLKRVQNQYKILDKIRKSKDYDNSPNCKNVRSSKQDRNMHSVVCDNDNELMSTTDESSMVKSLTNYWNNILNSKLEEESLFGSVSAQIQCCVENLNWDDGTQNVEIRKTPTKNIPIGLRHKSESSISITNPMKQLTTFNFLSRDCPSRDSVSIYGSSNDVFVSSTTGLVYEPDNDPVTENPSEVPLKSEHLFPTSSLLNENSCIVSLDSYSVDENRNKTNSKYSEICDVSANNAVEVLQKIINNLKLVPNTSILSDQIALPQSIKIMLVLITTKILSSREEIFLEDLKSEMSDGDINETNASKCQRSCSTQTYDEMFPNNELAPNSQPYFPCDNKKVLAVSIPKQYKYPLHKKEESKQNNIVAVPTPVLCLEKVMNALKYYTLLCNNSLWASFVFNKPTLRHYVLDEEEDFPSEANAYLVFERRIVIESVIDEELPEGSSEHEDDDDDLNIWGRFLRTVFSAASFVDDFVDFVLDQVILHWPNSKGDFLKIVYQVSVSFMIWWIILKEIFIK